MVRTVFVERTGGPEMMQIVEVDPGTPGPGQVRLRQTAVGINFIDVHYRRGTAPPHAMAKLHFPFIPGLEAAGIVEAVGPDVTAFKEGDRVGYASATVTVGAYTEARLFDAARLFPLLPKVSDVDAAALMYRGVTVHGLIRSCYRVKAGETVLLHAAAGGIGTILAQWASHLGATVIGTVGTAAKVEHARRNGCHAVIVTTEGDFVERVLQLTGDRGVDVVFDGVGADLFTGSFRCVRKYGTIVSVGQATGVLDPVDPVELQHRGIYLTKFSGSTYNADAADYRMRAEEVMDAIAGGVFSTGSHLTYRLDDIVQAHRDFEARRTMGPLVVVP